PSPSPTLFPYTTLFRSLRRPAFCRLPAFGAFHHARLEHLLNEGEHSAIGKLRTHSRHQPLLGDAVEVSLQVSIHHPVQPFFEQRSEEHTSELQSRGHLV